MLDALAKDGRPRDDVLGRSGGALLEVKWLARDVSERLAEVKQPCLIFHPRHDDRSALSASQTLQQRLGGVVDLIVLDDSYHLVTQDRQRALVLERVLEFADGLPQLLAPADAAAGRLTVLTSRRRIDEAQSGDCAFARLLFARP